MLIRRKAIVEVPVGSWVRHPHLGTCKVDAIINYPGARTAVMYDMDNEKQYSRTHLLTIEEPRAVVLRRKPV